MENENTSRDEKAQPAGNNGGNSESAPSSPGIDLESIRLSQDFAENLGVKKVLATVPVRKPERHWFVRTHPDPAYQIETAVLEFKDQRETFLVGPSVRDVLAAEVVPKLLITTINRQGNVFLWSIGLPNASGRLNPWHESALEAAKRAETRWVRVAANMSLGAYDIAEAEGDLGEPEWPAEPFERLIELAFRDRFIRSLDHPAVRQLKGLV
jgi:hypothetical protein